MTLRKNGRPWLMDEPTAEEVRDDLAQRFGRNSPYRAGKAEFDFAVLRLKGKRALDSENGGWRAEAYQIQVTGPNGYEQMLTTKYQASRWAELYDGDGPQGELLS